MTACRLMFNSLAALSSSSSIPDARSTFTLWIGPIMRPVLVKNCDTSFPWSARRAIVSAETGFRCLRVFCIKFLLLLGGLPERHQAVVLSLFVFPHFEYHGVQIPADPADRPVLFRQVRALVKGSTGARTSPAPLRIRRLFSGLLLSARSYAHRSETA